MKIDIQPGLYVVAVSGGVDSMTLLHALAQLVEGKDSRIRLVVAHFNHGIREDADEDQQLVADAANRYGLPYIYEQGRLGAGVSEAQAREARYAFLHRAKAGQGADAIITAHHQDDLLETAIINMIRGTGSRGLSSLRSAGDVVRPLLGVTKAVLLHYAVEHSVQWREDSTNTDERYLRNYVRRQLMPRLDAESKTALLRAVTRAALLNKMIDDIVAPYIAATRLDRGWFIQLPHEASREVMAGWLRLHGAAYDRKGVERLVVFAKTARPGKQASVDAAHRLDVCKDYVAIVSSL